MFPLIFGAYNSTLFNLMKTIVSLWIMQSRSFDCASKLTIATCPRYDDQFTIITNIAGDHAQIIDVGFYFAD